VSYEEKWEDVAQYVSTRSELEEEHGGHPESSGHEEHDEHAHSEDQTRAEAIEHLKKALRLTVPNPRTSLWLGKVEKKEHGEHETFEGLRGFSSEDLAMLAEKDVTVGSRERTFVDAAKTLLLLAGNGPKLEDSAPKAAEEVDESVEKALQIVERVANGVEDIGLTAAKLALLVTGAPFPAHGPVGIAKAVLWALQVTSWGGGFFGGSVFKLKEWAEKAGHDGGGEHADAPAHGAPTEHPAPTEHGEAAGEEEEGSDGLLGLITTNELLQAARRKALTFAGEGFGAYAGRSAEMVGGVSAEVIGGVSAEVLAAGIAELKGGVSAEVIGGAEAALKSNWGNAEVLGAGIEIGSRESQYMQTETAHVAVSGTHLIELRVGPSGSLESSLSLHGTDVHLEGQHTQIDSEVTVTRDKVSFVIDPESITAAASPVRIPMLAVQRETLAAARAAHKAASAAVRQLTGKKERRAAQKLVTSAYLASIDTATKTFRAALAQGLKLEDKPTLRVSTDGVTLVTPLAKVEVMLNGTVKVSQKSGASIELTGGAIKMNAPLGVSIESGANKWTFGPAGARGPGMSGH
jgi:hypothetical protein